MTRALRQNILVSNRQEAPIPAAQVRRAAGAALVYGGPVGGCLSVVIVGEREMRDLNRRFAHVVGTTDVLAFDMSEGPAGPDPGPAGEVIVNAGLAASEARRRRKRALDELLLYVVHGVLHLCGFGDSTSAQKRRMREAERAVMADIRRRGRRAK